MVVQVLVEAALFNVVDVDVVLDVCYVLVILQVVACCCTRQQLLYIEKTRRVSVLRRVLRRLKTR